MHRGLEGKPNLNLKHIIATIRTARSTRMKGGSWRSDSAIPELPFNHQWKMMVTRERLKVRDI
jgi:hypothetical protein